MCKIVKKPKPRDGVHPFKNLYSFPFSTYTNAKWSSTQYTRRFTSTCTSHWHIHGSSAVVILFKRRTESPSNVWLQKEDRIYMKFKNTSIQLTCSVVRHRPCTSSFLFLFFFFFKKNEHRAQIDQLVQVSSAASVFASSQKSDLSPSVATPHTQSEHNIHIPGRL